MAALSGIATTFAVLPAILVAVTSVVALTSVLLIKWARALPSRPLDLLLFAAIVFLPLAPAVSLVVPETPIFRLGLVLCLIALIVIRAAPVNRLAGTGGHMLVVAFVAYQVVVFVNSGLTAYAAIRFANVVMFVPLAFLAYRRHSIRVISAALAVVAVLLLVGVAAQMVGVLPGVWGGLVVAGELTTRYTSLIQNPNDLGLVSLGIFIVLLAALPHVGPAWRILIVGLAGSSLICVLMSGSRGALLAMSVVGGYLVVARHGKRALGGLAVGAIVVILVVAAIPRAKTLVGGTFGSLGDVITGVDTSANGRLLTWSSALGRVGNPVIGSGYGGPSNVAGQDLASGLVRSQLAAAATVDNSWLKLLVEEGVVGCVLLAAVWAHAFASALRLARRPATSQFGVVLTSLMIVIIFRSVSADIFDVNPWNMFAWLLIGLAYSVTAKDRPDPPVGESRAVDERETRYSFLGSRG